jgi:hypothetical protein
MILLKEASTEEHPGGIFARVGCAIVQHSEFKFFERQGIICIFFAIEI